MTSIDGLELISPRRYAEKGYPHEHWTELRRHDPVAWFEPEGYRGFWAITKHADISEVSKQPDKFLNEPRLTVMREEVEAAQEDQPKPRMLVNMDPPEHRVYRKLASPWFTPNNLRVLEERMAGSARDLVDKMMRVGREQVFDFVTEVAALHPLRLIAHLFGVPEEDEPFVLRVTNEIFGSEDPEFAREDGDRQLLSAELLAYFTKTIEDRRAHPRDDLASVLANAEVDGARIGNMEVFFYYLIVLTAGHETTRNAIAGGMMALLEHPDQLEKLRANPDLVPSAVDEMIRWATPVNHFVRTAACDYELRGARIRAGDSLCLFYASANRDEEVFEDPFAFRVDRHPNPHLAFGIGEHFCLGANLARMEIRVLLEALIPRLETLELGGAPERLASSFVGGIKHLPLRVGIRPAAGGEATR